MAAPSGVNWGSIVGDYGRIGLFVTTNTSPTKVSFVIDVWFWSKYSVDDANNTLYFDNLASTGSASTSRGSKSIKTTYDSGSGWHLNNQVQIASYSYEYSRTTKDQKRYIYARLANVDRVGGSMNTSLSLNIPALTTTIVAYRGASGANNFPPSQTKYYGISITLSNTEPVRSGYIFKKWQDEDGNLYSSGATYSRNSGSVIDYLTATWESVQFLIKYDANGGTGAPNAQQKITGATIKLSSTIPTRTGYSFLGWALSPNADSAKYAAGASYTANGNATLYAVWESTYAKPKISDLKAQRCNSDGSANDGGTSAKITFSWATTYAVTSAVISWSDNAGSYSRNANVSGTSGSSATVISDAFDTNTSYSLTVTVSDSGGSTSYSVTLMGSEYYIDFGEHGTAIGKNSEAIFPGKKALDVAWLAKFRDSVFVGDKMGSGSNTASDGRQGVFISKEGCMHLQRTTAQMFDPYIAFYLDANTEASGIIRLKSATGDLELDANNDLKFNIRKAGTAVSHIPYYKPGDTISVTIRTSGYVTNNYNDVCFCVPLSKPLIGVSAVTASSNLGLLAVSDNKYVVGSSSKYETPQSYAATVAGGAIVIKAVLAWDATINNAPLGVIWSGNITFS